ncbi:MAG: hypothetical protein QM817_23415 [Archangium sp.]
MKTRLGLLAVALVFSACPVDPPPGDQNMGTWSMTVDFVERSANCQLSELPAITDAGRPDPFNFEMVLTRDSTSDVAWMTLSGLSRQGTYDGQYFSNVADASRVFVECTKCQTRLVERIDFAVLSRSQADALGGTCPANPLDFGVVPTPNADSGIQLPHQTPLGFDAVRLCGEMSNEVVSDGVLDGGACPAECNGCFISYTVRGERR